MLTELVDHELVAVCDAGPPRLYRLLDASVLGAVGQLADPETIA